MRYYVFKMLELFLTTLVLLAITINVNASSFRGRNLVFNSTVTNDLKTSVSNVYGFKYQPKKEYVITTEVTNNSKNKQKFSAEILNANTGESGQVVYSKVSNDNGIRNIVDKTFQDGVINPLETKFITFKFSSDRQMSDGVLLGGIKFSELSNDRSSDIKNNISFVTSIIFGDKYVESSNISEVKLLKVTSIYSSEKNGYLVSIKNNNSKIIPEIDGLFQIYNEKNQLLFKKHNQISLTPNEKTTIFIPMSRVPKNAARITLTLSKGNERRVLKYDLSTKKEVKKNIAKDDSLFWGIITIGIISILLLVLKRRVEKIE